MRHYTTREVAERYSVKEDTVRRWVRVGTLEAIDIGSGERKIYRITHEALQKFEMRTRGDQTA